MRYLLSFTALSTLAFTAAQAEPVHFERDGIKYRYEEMIVGDGVEIVGRNLSTGENFKLRVRGGKVDGFYDNRRVNFSAAATNAGGQEAYATR